MIDIDAIRRANPLADVAAKVVTLRPAGKEWAACCPFHADRSPSFTIFDHGTRFHCFGCGASGDVLDFVQRAYGVPFAEAARMLGVGNVPRLNLPRPAAQANRIGEARAIWQRAIPAAGTLAETYLRFRGIVPPYPGDIRFLALLCGNLGPLPCLVAVVRNLAGDVTGVQRIWLTRDGRGKADVPRPKRSLGRVKGGAIRLAEPGPDGALVVCEGPEDGLSLMQMLPCAVWVAAGATFLPAMEFPDAVKTVVVAADNDAAGDKAAKLAAATFAFHGRSARILRPLPGFKDFNDELRGR